MSGVPSDPAEPAAVAARHVFYNGSALVGGPPLSPTDAAIAADKVALMPGQTASFRNVTSYARGVNGVIVDLARLPEASTLSAADFELHVGGPSGWSPLAGAPAVSVRRGAGAAGADRVTLTLPDYAARNTWLRVTVKATPGTGLASADTFYFGNLVGDTGGPGTPRVDVFDLAHTCAAVGRSTAAALNTFDFNRDGRINAIDLVIVRNNHGRTLTLFTAPSAAPTAAAAGAFSRQTVAPPPGRSRGGPDRRGIWDEPMQDLLS
jgi:hypothetical protein